MVQTEKPKPKSRIVEMAGKYGSTGSDSGRLSIDYKRIFGEGIAKKYGLARLKNQGNDQQLSVNPSTSIPKM